MFQPASPLAPDKWLANIFASKAAQEGRVVRRSLVDIDKYVGIDTFKREVARRGYSAVRNGDQVIVFCNRQRIQRFV
ncbi:MAG: N-(5'-phosphoribosyl)anthranilate isomerase [Pseudomonadota bacterium]